MASNNNNNNNNNNDNNNERLPRPGSIPEVPKQKSVVTSITYDILLTAIMVLDTFMRLSEKATKWTHYLTKQWKIAVDAMLDAYTAKYKEFPLLTPRLSIDALLDAIRKLLYNCDISSAKLWKGTVYHEVMTDCATEIVGAMTLVTSLLECGISHETIKAAGFTYATDKNNKVIQATFNSFKIADTQEKPTTTEEQITRSPTVNVVNKNNEEEEEITNTSGDDDEEEEIDVEEKKEEEIEADQNDNVTEHSYYDADKQSMTYPNSILFKLCDVLVNDMQLGRYIVDEKLKKLQKEYAELLTTVTEKDDSIYDLETQLEKLTTENGNLKRELNLVLEEIKAIKVQVQPAKQAEATLKEMKEKLSVSEELVSQLNKAQKDLIAKNKVRETQLNDRIEKLNGQLELEYDLKNKLKEKSLREIEDTKTEYQKEFERISEKYEAEIKNLKNRLATNVSQIDAWPNTKEEEKLQELAAVIESLDDDVIPNDTDNKEWADAEDEGLIDLLDNVPLFKTVKDDTPAEELMGCIDLNKPIEPIYSSNADKHHKIAEEKKKKKMEEMKRLEQHAFTEEQTRVARMAERRKANTKDTTSKAATVPNNRLSSSTRTSNKSFTDTEEEIKKPTNRSGSLAQSGEIKNIPNKSESLTDVEEEKIPNKPELLSQSGTISVNLISNGDRSKFNLKKDDKVAATYAVAGSQAIEHTLQEMNLEKRIQQKLSHYLTQGNLYAYKGTLRASNNIFNTLIITTPVWTTAYFTIVKSAKIFDPKQSKDINFSAQSTYNICLYVKNYDGKDPQIQKIYDMLSNSANTIREQSEKALENGTLPQFEQLTIDCLSILQELGKSNKTTMKSIDQLNKNGLNQLVNTLGRQTINGTPLFKLVNLNLPKKFAYPNNRRGLIKGTKSSQELTENDLDNSSETGSSESESSESQKPNPQNRTSQKPNPQNRTSRNRNSKGRFQRTNKSIEFQNEKPFGTKNPNEHKTGSNKSRITNG